MARKQVQKSIPLAFSTTPVQISAVTLNVTSYIIQAPVTNTDFISVGGADGQIFQIAPGRDLEIHGDNLDLGTGAYVDLSECYVKSVSGAQTANVLYLERF